MNKEKLTNAIATHELNRITIRMEYMFNYEIEKADSKEMKEYLKNLKEEFLLEFE